MNDVETKRETPPLRLKSIFGEVHFRNQPEEGYIPLTPEEILVGVCFIECPECEGTGVFHITLDDWLTCNYCKGSGEVLISC